MPLGIRKGTNAHRRIQAIVAGVAALTVASVGVVAASQPDGTGQPAPPAAAEEPGSSANWPMWQRDLVGTRYNANESKINPRTVGNLKLKWAYTYNSWIGAKVGSQPAIVDGVLYVGAPDAKFLSLDAKSGATRWTFDLLTVTGTTPNPGETDPRQNEVRNGASVVGDRVYFGDSLGRVYALNKNTGALLWVTRVSDHPTSVMTGSPIVYDGRVYIGVSSDEAGIEAWDPNYACCTHRGHVVALDANTGTVQWNYFTMRPAEKVGSWPSGADKFAPSGGGVWSSPVVDRRTRTLYVGTGNNYTGQEGDIDSLLALNIDTGQPRWKQRLTFPDEHTKMCNNDHPGDYCPGKGTFAKNFDVGATPNLINVGGRTLVTVGQKGGVYHAFDARTGEIAWQTRLAEPDANSIERGSYGIEWGSYYDGRYIYASTWRAEPGKIFALEPATGRIVWQIEHPADGCTTGGAAAHPTVCQKAFQPAVTGTPGLLYEGSADGKIRIFSSADGRLLWQFDALRDFAGVNGKTGRGQAISGNGGAVIVDGMLYVQAGYYPYYPSDKGTVLLAFGL